MKLTDFEAMSFDCYGTLIDWEYGLATVLGPWARTRGLQLDDETLLAAYSTHEARAEAEHPGESYPDILVRSLRELGRQFGAEVTDDDAQRLATSVPDWPAFPDSPAALTTLSTRYQLIILSNVDRDSFAARNQRLGHIHERLTAQDIGSPKPSHRNFAALLTEAGRLGIRDSRLLHVVRACSMTTSRPSGRDYAPCGSTGYDRLGWCNTGAAGSHRPGLGIPVATGACRCGCGRCRQWLIAVPRPFVGSAHQPRSVSR